MEPAKGNRILHRLAGLFLVVLAFITPLLSPMPKDTEHEKALPETALKDRELLDYMDAGDKVHAIMRFRELTGAGLKEAKDAIDALERENRTGDA